MNRHYRFGYSLFYAILLTGLCSTNLLLGSGCGDDDEALLRASLRIDRSTLRATGDATATVTVSVLRGNEAARAGTQVTLIADGPVDVEGTGERQATVATRSLGGASFQVGCDDAGEVTFEAEVEGSRFTSPITLTCLGDEESRLRVSIAASPRFIPNGATTRITARATTPSGSAAPTGTRVRLRVVEGPMLVAGGGPSTIRQSRLDGSIEVNFQADESGSGLAIICASFVDETILSEERCTNITIIDEPLDGPTCFTSIEARRVPANGIAVTGLNLTAVDDRGDPIPDATVVIRTELGELLDAREGNPLGTSMELRSDDEGEVSGFIRAGSSPGHSGLSAEVTFGAEGATETFSCNFDPDIFFFPRPVCSFDEMTPSPLGVRDSGRNETGTLTFCFADDDGTPVPAGNRIEFDWVTSIGGARLSATSSTTNDDGCASVTVQSGTQAGQVEARARFPFGQSSAQCTSGPQTIRGARPTQSGWTLSCDTDNLGARVPQPSDDSGSDIRAQGLQIECSTTLRDRFNNPVNFPGTQVFFRSEQGTIESPVTPDADGVVRTIFRPDGSKPRVVNPFSGEARALVAGTTGTFRNQRDMLTTITAWTAGEEGFEDSSGSGRFDEGDLFYDVGEPFFDYNDNNSFDPQPPVNESFIDVALPGRPENGEYDGPNAQWDGDTVIWTDTRVLLTGVPRSAPLSEYGLDGNSPLTSAPAFSYVIRDSGARVTGPLSLPIGQTRLRFIFRDAYFNPINPSATVSFSLESCGTRVSLSGDSTGSLTAGAVGFEQVRDIVYLDEAGHTVEESEAFSAEFRNRITFAPPESFAVPVSFTITSGQAFECDLIATVTTPTGGNGGSPPHNFIMRQTIRSLDF